jgi:hypothetical protein
MLDLNDRRVDAGADGFDAVIRHGPIADRYLEPVSVGGGKRLSGAPGATPAH